MVLFCTPEGPLVNTLTGFKRPLQYCPQVIEIAPPPKNLHPIFAKLSGVGANFLSSLYGDAQGPSEKKFGQLYLGPLTGNRISKFRGKSIFFELREIFVQRKILTVCAGVPPNNWAKVHPPTMTFGNLFRILKKLAASFEAPL